MFLTLIALAKIIGINLILSGDNAIVIALACKDLPKLQKAVGIALGAGGAVLARLALLFALGWVFDIPGVKLAGGVFLIWIAFKMVRENGSDPNHSPAETLFAAVATIVVADVMMSADNVIALEAAAHGNFNLLVIGILTSVPIIVFGATLLSGLLSKYPALVYAGSILLLYVAGETAFSDPLVDWL